MSNRIKGLLILVFAAAVICCVIVFVIIPKAAAITLPYRWDNIPLRQPRSIIIQYLGKPSDSLAGLTDTWIAKRNQSDYELRLTYTTDTVSTSYKLYFNYHLGFFHKQYLLVEK